MDLKILLTEDDKIEVNEEEIEKYNSEVQLSSS
jgi:hypothetical protein